VPYLTVKFKGRHSLYSEHDTRKDTVKLLQDLKRKRRWRGNRAPCAWAEEGHYSCHTATLVCLTVLHCGCLEGLPLQQSIIHHSFIYQYTSVTHDAVMPYACLQHVITLCFLQTRLLYAAILIRTQCLSQPRIMFLRVAKPFWKLRRLLKRL